MSDKLEVKGKITESRFKKTWENTKAKKGEQTMYAYNIIVDGYEEIGAIYISVSEKNQETLSVGKEVHLDASEGKYGYIGKIVRENSFKKSYSGPKKGSSYSKGRTLEETARMVRQTVVKVAAEVNKFHGDEIIGRNDYGPIGEFILGDIDGDLQNKWDDPKAQEMMSRQTAIHAAASETLVHSIESSKALVDLAEEKYAYIQGDR